MKRNQKNKPYSDLENLPKTAKEAREEESNGSAGKQN